MAQGCTQGIGSIGCYADEGENGSVAMSIGAIMTAFVAHIYISQSVLLPLSQHMFN